MKVYIIKWYISGEESECGIRKVYLDKRLAERYIENADHLDRYFMDIEEWEVEV